MRKKNLLALVFVAQIILLLAGCTPKIGVDPTSIDFGADKTEAKIKVWNDQFIVLKKLEFKVESNDDWVVGIMPVEDVSKKKKDVKEITILVSREGLTQGIHEGKLIISEQSSEDKKKVNPVEVGLKITVEATEGTPEGAVEGENSTPDIASVLAALGIGGGGSNFTYGDVSDNLAQVKEELKRLLGFDINVTLSYECNNVVSKDYFIRQVPVVSSNISAGGTLTLYFSSGPCPEGVVEGTPEGTPEGVVEGTPEGTPEGVVEGTIEGTPEGTPGIEVPNVIGLELADATVAITEAMLVVGNTIYECNNEYADGLVFNQEPTGGESVESGSSVDLWVSTGPCPEGEGTPEGVVEGTTEGTPEGVVEGTPEGTPEGVVEGTPEGVVEGVVEGTPEGVVEGVVEGTPEGVVEGVVEGTPEGVVEGVVEGTPEGVVEGVVEGTPEGTPEGVVEGTVEGTPEGVVEGTVEGTPEGVVEGVVEGTPEGVVEGTVEGTPEGTPEGVVEGTPEGTPEGVVEYTTVPDVVGLEITAATSEIANAILVVSAIIEECNDIYPAGVVFGQEPISGNTVEVGSLVNLWVSTGPCPEGEGTPEGVVEGTVEGTPEGTPEGVVEGMPEGTPEGTPEGVVEGMPEGTPEGTPEGVVEGTVEGTPEGTPEGVVEGTPEGVVEGEGEGTIEYVSVPYVIGETQSQANSDILSAGLTVGDVVETCSVDNYPAGIVIGQDPADGGNTAVLGSQVNLVVSCGPCTTVPDIVGEALTSALSTLVSYGLEIGDIINVCDNTAPVGSILIQDPAPVTNGCVAPNTNVIPVDLYVVCGPCYSVTFPYVVGNSESLAASTLIGLGYNVDDVVYVCDDSVPAGYVIDQYPPSDLNTPPLINTCNLDVDLLVSTGACK